MKNKNEKRFQIFVNILLLLLSLFIIMPFIILFMSSIASEKALVMYGYKFIPKEFSLEGYKYILNKSDMIVRAYIITIFVTAVGTTLSLIISSMLAYPLSRRDFKRRNIFTFIVLLTMLFNGGLVPSYIMWTRLFHIKNTISALIFPNLLVGAFGILLLRNYFLNNIPFELIQASKIDGAGEYRIFFSIVMPLSVPIVATLGLLTGLAYWNDWINGLYYITDSSYYSIQVMLNRILMDIQFLISESTRNMSSVKVQIPSVSVRMAIAVLGIVPIMILYPFFQKYFVKGITLGSIKG